jgi:hypothetical protein
VSAKLARVWLATLALLLMSAQAPAEGELGFRFGVLGHPRGPANGALNPRFEQAIASMRERDLALAVVTGDLVYGDFRQDATPARVDVVRAQWNAVDAVLARLGVPVYRVPGNHDVHDAGTRDLYFSRYPALPLAFSHARARFILLNSTGLSGSDGGAAPAEKHVRGVKLELAQRQFLERELASRGDYDHVFVFLHHVLWWSDDAAWWSEVHPLLAAGRVTAVFAGDHGPVKYSYLERDGVRYVQSLIATEQDPALARGHSEAAEMLSQLDNWMLVTVRGASVALELQVVGADSAQHSPASWRLAHGRNGYYAEAPSLGERLAQQLGSAKRLLALALLLSATGFAIGWCARAKRRG